MTRTQLYFSIVFGTSFFAILIGLSVLFGWYTDNRLLLQIGPNFAPMRYNPALCVVILGIGIILASLDYVIIARITALFVIAIGSLTIVEYGLDVNLYIDEILFKQTYLLKTKWPGRMAPNAALSLFFLGTSVLILTLKRLHVRYIVAKTFSAMLFAFNALAILGYLFSFELAYDWTNGSSNFALNAAFAFTFLSIGTYFSASINLQKELNRITDYIALGFILLTMITGLWLHFQYVYSIPSTDTLQTINFLFQILIFFLPLPIIILLALHLTYMSNRIDVFSKIFDRASDILISTNPEGEIVEWSDKAVQLFQYSSSEALMLSIGKIFPKKEIREILTLQGSQEATAEKKDGTTCFVELVSCPISDVGGKKTTIVLSIRDVTARREIDTMKANVAQMKSQFIATVAHELRTPITTIHNGLQAIEPTVIQHAPEEEKSMFSSITKNSEKLLFITQNILDYQALEKNIVTPQIEKIDIDTFLEDIHKSLLSSAEDKKLGFTVENTSNLHEFESDPKLLKRAMLQLSWNAIKYTDEGKISISVAQKGEYISFIISDTGKGLSEEEFKTVLTPLTQTDVNGTDLGLGLGIAHTKEIVDILQGYLEYIPLQESGTSLALTIPAKGTAHA